MDFISGQEKSSANEENCLAKFINQLAADENRLADVQTQMRADEID